MEVTSDGRLKCNDGCLASSFGMPCRHTMLCNKGCVHVEDFNVRWFKKFGCGQMDRMVKPAYADCTHPELQARYEVQEITLECDENQTLQLAVHKPSYQFSKEVDEETPQNPKNEWERFFAGMRLLDDF